LREKRKMSMVMHPNVAFGPVGGSGLENVSLVKSKVMRGFTLRGTLGKPEEVAKKLLSTVIAGPKSGKKYCLLNAYEESRQGEPAYIFEYTIEKDESMENNRLSKEFHQHSIAVIMCRGDDLFTLTAVSPEKTWADKGDIVKHMTDSFHLL
jgi:hypothetical protein